MNFKKQFVFSFLLCAVSGLASAQEAKDGSSKWWRGNLHTHSLWSDGDDFPEMIAKWYVDHDYHFLALTDHNVLSAGKRWMNLSTIKNRAGESGFEKYVTEFGEPWVETRDKPKSKSADAKSDKAKPATVKQVRLRTLDEFRGRFEKPGKFLMIQGEEISDRAEKFPIHMNATNLRSVISPAGGETVVEAINNNLRVVAEQAEKNGQPILVHLNHPNFGWAVTAEELAQVTNEKFFEVYNGHPAINHLGDKTRPSVEKMWDICNTIRIAELKSAPLFGLATDDSHNYHGQAGKKAHMGRGWVMVKAPKLEASSLIKAMNAGDFYSSSGVVLKSVQFDQSAGTLSLEIESVEGETFKTEFIGTMADFDRTAKVRLDSSGKPVRATRVYSKDVGKVLEVSESLKPTYTFTGGELFVRATVTSSRDHVDPSFEGQKKQAWTQPVSVKKQ